MRNRLITASAVVAIGLAATLHLYFIDVGAGALLLWKQDKAYLIIKVGRLGYRMTYLRYLPEPILERLYYSPSPDVESDYAVMFEITPETVHRFEFDDMGLSCGDPLGQYLYCGSKLGLVKWTGREFERATQDDRQRLMKFNLPPNYDGVSGWSKRSGLPQGKTEIRIGGKPVTIGRSGEDKKIAIDLLLPGRPSQRIWDEKEGPQRVGKAQYDAAFRGR